MNTILRLLVSNMNDPESQPPKQDERFDRWLHQRDPQSGIKDFDDLDRMARQAGMGLQEDYEMPVNNRILCWRKN